MSHQHKWGLPVRFQFKTERACLRPGCTVVKVTRHEPGAHPPSWREWWCDGVQIVGVRTPPCIGTADPPPAELESVEAA